MCVETHAPVNSSSSTHRRRNDNHHHHLRAHTRSNVGLPPRPRQAAPTSLRPRQTPSTLLRGLSIRHAVSLTFLRPDAHGGVNISEGRNSAPLAVTIPHHGTNSTYVHTYIHTYFFGVGRGEYKGRTRNQGPSFFNSLPGVNSR